MRDLRRKNRELNKAKNEQLNLNDPPKMVHRSTLLGSNTKKRKPFLEHMIFAFGSLYMAIFLEKKMLR